MHFKEIGAVPLILIPDDERDVRLINQAVVRETKRWDHNTGSVRIGEPVHHTISGLALAGMTEMAYDNRPNDPDSLLPTLGPKMTNEGLTHLVDLANAAVAAVIVDPA